MTDKSKHANSRTRYGNGRGHGGPAKGAGRVIPTIQTAPDFSTDHQPESRAKSWRALSKEERLDAIREAQWADAFDPALPPRDRFAARVDLQNRIEGTPIARTMDMRSELERLSDEQLGRAVAEIRDALGGDLGEAEPRTGEATQPQSIGRISPIH